MRNIFLRMRPFRLEWSPRGGGGTFFTWIILESLRICCREQSHVGRQTSEMVPQGLSLSPVTMVLSDCSCCSGVFAFAAHAFLGNSRDFFRVTCIWLSVLHRNQAFSWSQQITHQWHHPPPLPARLQSCPYCHWNVYLACFPFFSDKQKQKWALGRRHKSGEITVFCRGRNGAS